MDIENNASATVAESSENATVNAVNSAASVQPETANKTSDNTDSNTVTLGYALMRGDQEIKTISFRKPVTGDLRGLSVTQLLNTDVDQMSAFLPRITTPSIMASEIEKLPVSDFLNLSMKALGFFTESPSQTA